MYKIDITVDMDMYYYINREHQPQRVHQLCAYSEKQHFVDLIYARNHLYSHPQIYIKPT